MKASIELLLGGNKLVVESEGTEKSIMEDLSFWSGLPTSCGACKSSNIELTHRKPKGYDYYGLKCKDCGATVNFGQSREGGKFFIKWDAKWEKYQGGSDAKASSNEPAPLDDDDLQF